MPNGLMTTNEAAEELRRCPTCDSPAPHLHPAVQSEGEVETCVHDFHMTPTPQNGPGYIALVVAKREQEKNHVR